MCWKRMRKVPIVSQRDKTLMNYHFVKQTHQQQEARSIKWMSSIPALTPVLRPYQREAVSWMLQQEHFKSTPAISKYKMLKEGKLIRVIR